MSPYSNGTLNLDNKPSIKSDNTFAGVSCLVFWLFVIAAFISTSLRPTGRNLFQPVALGTWCYLWKSELLWPSLGVVFISMLRAICWSYTSWFLLGGCFKKLVVWVGLVVAMSDFLVLSLGWLDFIIWLSRISRPLMISDIIWSIMKINITL